MAWPLLRAWNRLARGVPLERFIPRSTVAVIASMVLFWWLYGYVWPWPRFLFYVWISIVTLLVFSQFWSWASQLLDPRQARRLFAFVLSGALVGGVAGGQVATMVTRWIDARATLLAAAAILLATLPLIARIRTLSAGVGPDGAPPLDRRAHRRCRRLAARDLALAPPALGGGADVPVDHGGRDHRPPVQLGSRAGDRPARPAHHDLRQFLQRDGAALLRRSSSC